MRTLLVFPLAVIILIIVIGCTSRVPEPVTHEYSQQKKMQAPNHWAVLAQDLANKINNQLILSDNIEKAVFVEETCGDEATPCSPNETSSFNEAFRDLLITGLYSYGIPTNSTPDPESINVLYKVQVVRHNANRARTIQPGLLTALSAAVIVLRDAPSDLLILASGIAADVANSSIAIKGSYEVIITTSMIDNNQYLFRASDIYYINDKDFFHYQEVMPQTTTIKLSSKAAQEKKSREQYEHPQSPAPLPVPKEKNSTKDI